MPNLSELDARELPILFSGPMVRALLAGSKTQTRRVHKVAPGLEHIAGSVAPRIRVGDRLYVREHWRVSRWNDDLSPSNLPKLAREAWAGSLSYVADGEGSAADGRFRQGMHMPKWASRITLTVTDVRVQRLQDISDTDAQAEGTPCYVCDRSMDGLSEADCHCFHRKADASDYTMLWEAINGPGSWDANPWVAAYTFTVERRNIDAAISKALGEPHA
jgi:hypothetical protein